MSNIGFKLCSFSTFFQSSESTLRSIFELKLSIFTHETFLNHESKQQVRPKSRSVVADIAEFVRQVYPTSGSGIVYCLSRRNCEQVFIYTYVS